MEKSSSLSIVVALDDLNGIGRENRIPWTIKNDLKFFRFVTSKIVDPTKQNAMIVGRKTFQTFPKALPNRLNIVVTSQSDLSQTNCPNVRFVKSFSDALKLAENDPKIEQIFVIGGVSIYEEAMKTGRVKRLFVTRVKGDFQCTAVWSSFDVSKYKRIETIPEEFRQFFDENETSNFHLEIYERVD